MFIALCNSAPYFFKRGFLDRSRTKTAPSDQINSSEANEPAAKETPDEPAKEEELEKENSRLKRLLADAELDNAILNEALTGKY